MTEMIPPILINYGTACEGWSLIGDFSDVQNALKKQRHFGACSRTKHAIDLNVLDIRKFFGCSRHDLALKGEVFVTCRDIK